MKFYFQLLVIVFSLFSLNVYAEQHKIMLTMSDTFIVSDTEEWDVKIEKELMLRMAEVKVLPKKGHDFNLKLYFKSDTPDLAHYNSSAKMKRAVAESSQKYLPYIVENKIELKEMGVADTYGWITKFTDAKLVNKKQIPKGEFKYMTRGMLRLSKDSALGFSIMTNEIDTPKYQELIDYIVSFAKCDK